MNNVTIMENGLRQAFNEEEYPLIVRYLRNISFNIEDYIRDSILFLKKTLNDNPYIMSRSKLRNNFYVAFIRDIRSLQQRGITPLGTPIDKTRCRKTPLHGSF